MKLKFFSILIVLIIGLVLSSGCSSTKSQSSPSENQLQGLITKDLSSAALTIDDLPDGWMTYGDSESNQSTYEKHYLYNAGGRGNTLTILLLRANTVNIAHEAFLGMKATETMDTQVVSVGDEGYATVGTTNSGIIFRRGNVFVSLSTRSYPAIKASELLAYAKIIDNRLIS